MSVGWHRVRAQPVRDPDLVRGVALGDLGALGELYDRYALDVWRAAHRSLPQSADAEDVVHATFMKLPELAASYDGRASCRNWLCGIAVRLAMRHRRSAGRFRRMLDAFAHAVASRSSGDPERKASGNQELALLESSLARLSEKKRAVFVLVELEGLSTEEVAGALEIPAATVRTRLFHARRELQQVLRAGGVR
ncbi:MAG: RNA polymerase sigma factor [Polyangiaceae bacterium]